MVSDRVSSSKVKYLQYVLDDEVDEEIIILLFIKISKNIFSYSVTQNGKSSAYTMQFNASEIPDWVLHFSNILNEVDSQLFEKLTTEFLKGEG